MSSHLSPGASGAIRRFAGWVARGSVGHPLLDGIDYWDELRDSPSQMEIVLRNIRQRARARRQRRTHQRKASGATRRTVAVPVHDRHDPRWRASIGTVGVRTQLIEPAQERWTRFGRVRPRAPATWLTVDRCGSQRSGVGCPRSAMPFVSQTAGTAGTVAVVRWRTRSRCPTVTFMAPVATR